MEFKAGDMIRFGWETFKKRPWFFVQLSIVQVLLMWAIGVLSDLFSSGGNDSFMSFTVELILNVLLGMGVTALMIKAHDSLESITLRALWNPDPFLSYLGAGIIYGLGIILGSILLIIPGIIVLVTYQFGSYVVIDRNLGPIEALKESGRITKGYRWELFLLLLYILGLNILGMLALLAGLLVTIPLSMLAVVHAYRVLEHRASEVTPVSA
jgi:uncharacterized membrane protein